MKVYIKNVRGNPTSESTTSYPDFKKLIGTIQEIEECGDGNNWDYITKNTVVRDSYLVLTKEDIIISEVFETPIYQALLECDV